MENIYLVIRDKGNVIVQIMYNRSNQRYHFVNLTKGHICLCAFETISDAIADMQNEKDNGTIIDFIPIEKLDLKPNVSLKDYIKICSLNLKGVEL